MSINTNAKTAATAIPSMVAALVAAKARKAEAKAATALQLRKQLEEAVGKDHTVPRLEAMRIEARDAMEGEELADYEAQLDTLVQVRKDLEKVSSEAKHLQTIATEEGMTAYLDRKVEAQEVEKARKDKIKAQEVARKATEAQEARIQGIIGDLGDITPGQRGAVTAFLRGNPWEYHPTPGGRAALKSAAGRAAADFNKISKAKAAKARKAEAAAAPLTHKVKLGK